MLATISSSLTHQIAVHGIYATFALLALDAVIPAASELVMLYAGAVAGGFATDHINVFGARIGSGAAAYLAVATAGTLGYLVGAIVGWWIGHRGGRPLLQRHGSWLHMTEQRLDRAQQWFERWDRSGVFIGRLVPVVRSFISIPAGIFEMPLGIYVWLTLLGSALWAFGLAGVGFALGARYAHVDHFFHYAEYAVAVIVIVIVGRALRPSSSSTHV
jgi:membrane protein DedA with SNARE-associated domain